MMEETTIAFIWLGLMYTGLCIMLFFGIGVLPFNLYRWHKAEGLYNLYKYLSKSFLNFILMIFGLILAMVAYSQIDYGTIGI